MTGRIRNDEIGQHFSVMGVAKQRKSGLGMMWGRVLDTLGYNTW